MEGHLGGSVSWATDSGLDQVIIPGSRDGALGLDCVLTAECAPDFLSPSPSDPLPPHTRSLSKINQ